MGMTRRLQHYADPGWQPLLLVAAGGAASSLSAFLPDRAALRQHPHARGARDVTGDPWNGRTLEWATSSPPPAYNFAVLPQGRDDRRVLGDEAARAPQARLGEEPRYADIEMPRNSPTGFITAFFAVVTGFALIWHIWWMVALAAVGAYATFVVFAWRDSNRRRHSRRCRRAHRSRQSKRARRGARRTGGDAMTAFDAAAPMSSHRPERERARKRRGTRPANCCRSASSSPTASGYSSSATSSCSRLCSRPMRCWSGKPPAGRAARSCSTCAMS